MRTQENGQLPIRHEVSEGLASANCTQRALPLVVVPAFATQLADLPSRQLLQPGFVRLLMVEGVRLRPVQDSARKTARHLWVD